MPVYVAAGVILRESRILVSKRHQGAHQGGLWEFPGGKVEADESVEQALARELKEELGIVVNLARPLMKVEHDYGDKQVVLDVWLVRDFAGEAVGREGQVVQWCSPEGLAELAFPEANSPIVEEVLRLAQAGAL